MAFEAVTMLRRRHTACPNFSARRQPRMASWATRCTVVLGAKSGIQQLEARYLQLPRIAETPLAGVVTHPTQAKDLQLVHGV